MNNNWKDYQVKPDEGLFDAVHRRLRVRRILRIAAVAFVAVSVALVVVLSTVKDTTSPSVNEQSSVRNDRIASQVTPQHAIHNAEASPAVEPEDAPQAEPAVKAVGKLVAEESMPLLQPQAAVPVVVEPVTDANPAGNTVRQPAATPVNPMQDTPVITAEPDTPYVVQETQAVANASSAKVGGADPVGKTNAVLEELCRQYDYTNKKSFLSPSALNKYMDCKLQFYLAQIAGLKKPDETDTDIDFAMFGTLFHKSAELTYNYLASETPDSTVTSQNIEALLKDYAKLDSFVQQAFTLEYFNKRPISKTDYSGTQAINYEVILKYLRQILRMDMELYAPFQYIGSESDGYTHYITVPNPLQSGSTLQIRLKGIIDRIDLKDGILRIVDYKT